MLCSHISHMFLNYQDLMPDNFDKMSGFPSPVHFPYHRNHNSHAQYLKNMGGFPSLVRSLSLWLCPTLVVSPPKKFTHIKNLTTQTFYIMQVCKGMQHIYWSPIHKHQCSINIHQTYKLEN